MRLRTLALVFAGVLAACGSDAGEQRSQSGHRGLALARCDDLDAARREPVDGPLSTDPEVAAWQLDRADYGMPSDIDSTLEASRSTPTGENAGTSFGFPMTDEEYTALGDRSRQADAAANAVRPLVIDRPGYLVIGVDNATGTAWVGYAGETNDLQREIDDEIGPGRVQVRSMPLSAVEIDDLHDRVVEYLDDSNVSWVSLGRRNALGRVTVGLEILDPESVADLAEAFDGETDAMCVDGTAPEDTIPDGPQPPGGDGWRLLADEPGAGVPHDTGVAVDDAGYEELWDEIGLRSEPPDVDFETEFVVWFGPAVSGSCDDVRLDDVTYNAETETLQPVIVLPGGARSCTSDANPHAYVVAYDRAGLPDQFNVTLGPDVPDTCCPESRTPVDLHDG